MDRKHDGLDYMHRQRILPHYKLMAISKKRLKFMTLLHMALSLLFLIKLSSTILDLLEIFWQPIEELYIPMADPWEWVWLSSVLPIFFAFSSIKTNSDFQIKLFMLGITLTCILPTIYCLFLHSTDFITYVLTKDPSKTSKVWLNYPVALYWYIFSAVALQVHAFELFFAYELWTSFKRKRE